MTFRADLHTHTTCSDGSLTPQELIAEAKARGLQGLCITDHDTLEAYHNLHPSGLQIGVGVEFSCHHRKEAVHILAYDVDLDSFDVKNLCARHIERRENRNALILEKLALIGIPITESELSEASSGKVVGRPHIAAAMLKKGYILSIQEGFNRFLAENKPAYVPGAVFSVEETLSIIHKAHGKAFLAHPHLAKSKKLVKQLLDMPFDGIEGYYGKFKLDEQEPWLELAKERNLLVSGGSDFHGSTKPHVVLGSSWVGEDVFHQIFQKILR